MNLKVLSQRSDVALAIFLILVIFIMIMPLPTFLVDLLIAFNIGIAIVMLMISIYMFSPLSFSSFPSVLLIATLFRLSLSVTTTRLIMLDADAGDIITTFGNFVVGGNLVVGVVVFLIITVVQFLVITKGSERVAEVAARFSLDGLPGKQMSIDADMRAGSIDAIEAKRRRLILEKESQLYGSLDGAMKFVKGDAIAGIIITIINIIGGISIGTLQQDMSFGEAGKLYTILTIGDGLVNQIPALFIALASGIIVTRVSSDEFGNLGQDIGKQVFGNPKAMMMGASAMIVFAAIPGFPSIIFLSLGLLAGGGGLYKILKKNKRSLLSSTFVDASSKSEHGSDEFLLELPFTAAISIELDEGLSDALSQDSLNAQFYDIRRNLNNDLGVTFPGVHMRYRTDFNSGQFSILIHDIAVAKGTLLIDKLLASDPKNILPSLSIEITPAKISALDNSFVWVDIEHENTLLEKKLSYLTADRILIQSLSSALRINASEFIDTQEACDLTNQLKNECGDLVRELLGVVSLQLIGEVLKKLISEDVSIRNLRGISESILKRGKEQTDVNIVVQGVRADLKRQISNRYADEHNVLHAIMFAPQTQAFMRDLLIQSGGLQLPLSPTNSRELIEKLKELVSKHKALGDSLVVVIDQDLRRFIRSYTSLSLPMLPILSFQEISPGVSLEPIDNLIIENVDNPNPKKVAAA